MISDRFPMVSYIVRVFVAQGGFGRKGRFWNFFENMERSVINKNQRIKM